MGFVNEEEFSKIWDEKRTTAGDIFTLATVLLRIAQSSENFNADISDPNKTVLVGHIANSIVKYRIELTEKEFEAEYSAVLDFGGEHLFQRKDSGSNRFIEASFQGVVESIIKRFSYLR